jgi:hypothetical protein
MSEPTATTAPDLTALELDIVERRQSLERKLNEIGRRLQPDEVKAELKDALKRRVDPEPYLGYIGAALVAFGALMAMHGWRRARRGVAFPAGDYPMPT